MSVLQAAGYNMRALLLGLSAVWFHAAIRPRYGAGPRAAVCAGLAVWFVGYALSSAAGLISGMFPARLMLIAMVWGLGEVVVATLAGCWFYDEGAAA